MSVAHVGPYRWPAVEMPKLELLQKSKFGDVPWGSTGGLQQCIIFNKIIYAVPVTSREELTFRLAYYHHKTGDKGHSRQHGDIWNAEFIP